MAAIHGSGYNLFGFKDVKPGYWKRFFLQVASAVITYEFSYLIGTAMATSGDGGASALLGLMEAGAIGFYVIIALFSAVAYHVSLTAATYFFGTRSVNVALKSPLICTCLVFTLMAAPALIIVLSA